MIQNKTNQFRSNGESIDSEHNLITAASLPEVILELILKFLPDTAVTTMARVCTAWHNEIRISSWNLWQDLLDRNEWPHCVRVDDSPQSDEAQRSFKMHYEVVRDVHAIKDALSSILGPSPSRQPTDPVETVYHSFAATKGAPLGACVSMASWSSTEVLAAYEFDCSIRLFQAVGKKSGNGRTCRELIRVCVDPNRNTTKKQACLKAMALGDTKIMALTYMPHGEKSHRVSIVSREDFLSSACDTTSGRGWSELEEGALTTVDIGQLVVDFMRQNDDVDIIDNFTDGDLSYINVTLSCSIVNCGKDRVLLYASVRISDFVVCSRYAVFSALSFTIVSMFPVYKIEGRSDWPGEVMMGLSRSASDCRAGCSAVSVFWDSATIALLEVDATGHIFGVTCHEHGESVWDSITIHLSDMMSRTPDIVINQSFPRSVVYFPDAVVVVDVFREDRESNCSIVTLFPLEGDCRWRIFEHCTILKIQRMRDEYLLLLCREHDRNLEDDGNLGDSVKICAIVLHVPTFDLITRVYLPNMEAQIEEWAVFSSGNMLSVGAGSSGIVMTGRDVRAVNDHHLVTNPTDATVVPRQNYEEKKKKKKNRPPGGSCKKDGFARGMR